MSNLRSLFAGVLIVMEVMFSAVVDGKDVPWTQAYDFDNDGKNDTIEVMFTGGAHCCYSLVMRLSATGTTHRLPFELDGGYVAGLDLSQPQRFTVRRSPNDAPEGRSGKLSGRSASERNVAYASAVILAITSP